MRIERNFWQVEYNFFDNRLCWVKTYLDKNRGHCIAITGIIYNS